MYYYDGWDQQQQHHPMLDNHWYYPQYVDEVYAYRQRILHPEEDVEQVVDETRDTLTSATSSELFRLEFAASQWSKLVSNAEGLFNKLILSNVLPHNEQDQIEQWLCMKQEYEECITSDSVQGFENMVPDPRRSLERIEEETDENFHRNEFESESCSVESELSEEDDEEQTDTDSESPDFLEKLDDYMSKFKKETDRLVESKKDVFGEMRTDPVPMAPKLMNNNELPPIIKPIPIRNTSSRRNSILPGSEMCQELMAFGDSLKNQQNQNYQYDIFDKFMGTQGTSNMNRDIELQNISEEDSSAVNAAYLAFQKENSPDLLVDALKTTDFFETTKTTKSSKLDTKQSQVKQIQTDPTESRSSSKEPGKTSETKLSIKQRFSQKKNKTEESMKDSKDKLKKKSENKNDDAESVASEKKSTDSKKLKQLKKEEQRKKQKESKKSKQSSVVKSKEIQSDSEDDKSAKLKLSKKARESAKMNTIMSQIDNALKEKSTTMKRTVEEIEDLRNEIRNVRKTRDDLLDRKCALKEKCKLEGNLSQDERRALLECGEVVEVIDHVIEHKNEMICGRKDFDEHRAQRERGVQMLMKRLSKLTDGELKTLFYLYFIKVIDLKESTKILERQLDEVEMFYNAKFQDYQIATQKKVKQFLQYQYLQLTSKNGISEHDKVKFNKYKKEIRDLRQQLANVTALLKGKVVPRTSSPSRIPRQELKQIGNNNGATTTITMEGHKMVFRKTPSDKVKK